jgi:NADH-quinone oxidoreductase E subunit
MSLQRGHPSAPGKQPLSFAFTPENEAEAKRQIAKYPPGRQQSAVMPLLYLVQKQLGWVPLAGMDAVADMLQIPHIAVYEVATFYTMFNLEPVGRYLVQICTTTPCMLRDSDGIAETCMKHLGIGWDETTADGKFTLKEVECLGACVNAPMVQINDDYYEDLTPQTMVDLLEALGRGEAPKIGPQNGRHTSEPASGLTTLKGGA